MRRVRGTSRWIDSTFVATRQTEEAPLIVLLRVLSGAITRASDVCMSISIVNFCLSKDSFDTELLTPNMKRARTVGGACPRVMRIGMARSSLGCLQTRAHPPVLSHHPRV